MLHNNTNREIRRKAITKLEGLSAERPVILALIIFGIAALVVVGGTFFFFGYDYDFFRNVAVEAHGMLLDLLVIGVLVFWLTRLGEHRQTVSRYQEEIEDYLGWQEAEATYRIVGNIRRLNRLGITNIGLHGAYLRNANLEDVDLSGSDLLGAYLQGADLSRAILCEAHLSRANLESADMFGVDFRGADLSSANLTNVRFIEAELVDVNLCGANLTGANLYRTFLKGIKYDNLTIWPKDFIPTSEIATKVTDEEKFGI